MRFKTTANLLLCASLLAGTATSQGKKSDSAIRDEIEFARGLAREWRFLEMAEDVISEVERAGAGGVAGELGLVKCEIYSEGARFERDPARRRELFDTALSSYESFIEENPYAEAKEQAETGFVDTAAAYGKAIEADLGDAVGEEADALRGRLVEVLEKAVFKTGDLIAGVKAIPSSERKEDQNRQLYGLMLNRGEMLQTIGTHEEDGTGSFSRAEQILEELIFDAGDGTPYALRAYVGIGKIKAAQEQWAESSIYYKAVVEQAIPADRAKWDKQVEDFELNQGQKDLRWLFVELGTGGLLEAYVNAGQTKYAVRYALHYYNTWKREGFALSKPLGNLSLLAVAETLLDVGGYIGGDLGDGEAKWYETEDEMKSDGNSRRQQRTALDLALSIAKDVNEENRGNTLQLAAQRLISDVIERPGVVVDTGVLYEAAEGAYYDSDFLGAIDGFKRVLVNLESSDDADRTLYGSKVMFFIGRCYQRLERHLEAAMAFEAGATVFQGDPEYDPQNAKQFLQSAKSLQAGDDPALKTLLTRAENIFVRIGEGDSGSILFRNAENFYRAKDYEAARAKYAEVAPDADDYEKALVQISVCDVRLGKLAGAEQALQEYTEVYVKDPTHSVEGNEVRSARRSDALATAYFYRTFIAHTAAKKDGNWDRVIELGGGYEDRFSDQDRIAPRVMRFVGEAHLAKGEVEAAKEVHAKMVRLFKESADTGSLSAQVYKTYLAQRETVTDPAEFKGLTEKLAGLLQIANDTSSSPAYANLRAESRHWIELEEWETAEKLLQRIFEQFKDDSEYEKVVARTVIPDLARAKLQQGKVLEAKLLLAPLVEPEGSLPYKEVAQNYCRSVVGWVEGDPANPTIVPGAGETDEEFALAAETLNKLAGALDKWECEWYSAKFDLMYAYYSWGQRDGRKIDSAKSQLKTMQSELGDQFSAVQEKCNSIEDRELRASLGNDLLRRRYVWLRSQLR